MPHERAPTGAAMLDAAAWRRRTSRSRRFDARPLGRDPVGRRVHPRAHEVVDAGDLDGTAQGLDLGDGLEFGGEAARTPQHQEILCAAELPDPAILRFRNDDKSHGLLSALLPPRASPMRGATGFQSSNSNYKFDVVVVVHFHEQRVIAALG